jgi:hypothetical protein
VMDGSAAEDAMLTVSQLSVATARLATNGRETC